MKVHKLGHVTELASPPKPQEEKLKEVAALYEKEFTRQLVKSMRATVPNSGLVTQNQAEKFFSEELYNHYGDLMADGGPQSLRQHIYKNLLEKFGPQLGLANKELKPIGMLPLPNHGQSQTLRVKHTNLENGIQYRFQWADKSDLQFDSSIVAPIQGRVKNISAYGDHKAVTLTLEHGKGLTSEIKFLGTPLVKIGDYLNAGQQVAQLESMGRELVWTLQDQGLKASSE